MSKHGNQTASPYSRSQQYIYKFKYNHTPPRLLILLRLLLMRETDHYTDTEKSLNAAFSDVFVSVDGFRFPIINAHGT